MGRKKIVSLQALRHSKQMVLLLIVHIKVLKALGNREAYVKCFISFRFIRLSFQQWAAFGFFFYFLRKQFSGLCDVFGGSQGGESTNVNLCFSCILALGRPCQRLNGSRGSSLSQQLSYNSAAHHALKHKYSLSSSSAPTVRE